MIFFKEIAAGTPVETTPIKLPGNRTGRFHRLLNVMKPAVAVWRQWRARPPDAGDLSDHLRADIGLPPKGEPSPYVLGSQWIFFR